MRRRTIVGGATLAGLAASTRPVRRAVRRRIRHLPGRVSGLRYWFTGGHPDPFVDDLVLADRVRSELGWVVRWLDVPHPNVMVENGVVLLHGVVGTGMDRAKIERAVHKVPGVEGVESYLHVGMLGGDTRPSEGRWEPTPSPASERLLAAAADAGAGERAGAAMRAVLATLSDRLPVDEGEHLFAHLPGDVRMHLSPPRRRGRRIERHRTVQEFVRAVASAVPELTDDRARLVTESVLGALRELVPEERADVAAVLPPELRALWEHAVPQ